jgi:hypothetical protein
MQEKDRRWHIKKFRLLMFIFFIRNQCNSLVVTVRISFSLTVGLATRDGFTANNFHNKFDVIENTLTVIKSKSGSIFGVLTEKAWMVGGAPPRPPSSTSLGYVDSRALIFFLLTLKILTAFGSTK